MSPDNENIQQMVGQLSRLCDVLLILGRDIAPKNPQLYAVMAEGPVDQIVDLLHQVAEAAGLSSL
jgi:hypothetical protein